jgi:hypothetical protein
VTEATSPVKKSIPTYQRPTQASRTTTSTTTTTLRQTQLQQKSTALRNGRSLSGSKIAEPKVQKEAPKVAAKSSLPAPSVKVNKNTFLGFLFNLSINFT